MFLSANATLRDVKSSIWDTAGWNYYLTLVKNNPATEEEKLKVWIKAIDLQHKNWTNKYRQYKNANGIYAKFSENEEKERDEKDFAADMDTWEEVRIKRIERIDGTLKFFTDDGETFEMDIKDIYSQTEFKKAFTVGTTILIPSIKDASYQKFLASIKIIKIENIGATFQEKIEEVFEAQINRLKDATVENEKDALECVESRSFAIFGNVIYFRINALASELKKDSQNLKQSSIITALRDMNAENIKFRKFNFWKYDLDSRDT